MLCSFLTHSHMQSTQINFDRLLTYFILHKHRNGNIFSCRFLSDFMSSQRQRQLATLKVIKKNKWKQFHANDAYRFDKENKYGKYFGNLFLNNVKYGTLFLAGRQPTVKHHVRSVSKKLCVCHLSSETLFFKMISCIG